MTINIGELIDRVSIINCKLWHVQEKVYAAAAAESFLDAETTKQLAILNLERAALLNAINHWAGEQAQVVKLVK